MFRLDNSLLAEHTDLIEKQYLSGKGSALYFDKFCDKTLNRIYKDVGKEYPKKILLPRSIQEMLEGDTSPSQIIELNEPLTWDGKFPIWSGNSTQGIALRGAGYKNGDSRYPCDVALGDKFIHAILGGVTGHGKSVTLNSIACGVAIEYAPWEVQLHMIDAKVVEFKKYAGEFRLPHIAAIAATTDADYIISVLEGLHKEMMSRNAMFAANGTSNIMEFRKKTGLSLCRNLITMDEFQAMFKNAQRKAKLIEAIIDDYARLGRNTGYHLLMASQETEGIPAATLGNIGVRMALGCNDKVSNQILGNGEGKVNLNTKGKLIINTNAANGNKEENMHFRVPYQPDEMFYETFEVLSNVAKSVGYKQNMSFYDEAKVLRENKFLEFCQSKGGNPYKLYLGEPSFVMRDKNGDNDLRIELEGPDIENILILGDTPKTLSRYSIMLKENMKAIGKKANSVVFSADKKLVEMTGIEDISAALFDIKSDEDPNFRVYIHNIYRRKLALDVDNLAYANPVRSSGSDAHFYDIIEKGSEFDTETNMYRCHAFFMLTYRKDYMDSMGFQDKDNSLRYKEFVDVLNYMKHCGAEKEQLRYNMCTPLFVWVMGIDKIIGWGRDSKSSKVDRLKKVLQDCTEANVRFIIATTSMEGIEDLKSGIRFSIMDGITERVAKKAGCDEYPETVSSVLGVFHDKYGEIKEPLKFKKMGFLGENFV